MLIESYIVVVFLDFWGSERMIIQPCYRGIQQYRSSAGGNEMLATIEITP